MTPGPAEPTLQVLAVVGTGDPIDAILIIPLVNQWRAIRACGLGQDVTLPIGCERVLARILTLSEPGLEDDHGHFHRTLAMCEEDYQSWLATLDVPPDFADREAAARGIGVAGKAPH